MHFGTKDSRHEEEIFEGEKKNIFNPYKLLKSWLLLVLTSGHLLNILCMASPIDCNLHACHVCP
jgi:hypothetical protein